MFNIYTKKVVSVCNRMTASAQKSAYMSVLHVLPPFFVMLLHTTTKKREIYKLDFIFCIFT